MDQISTSADEVADLSHEKGIDMSVYDDKTIAYKYLDLLREEFGAD